MNDKQTNGFITFDNWFRILQKMAISNYNFQINVNDADFWQEYYDDGFTPREALDED